MPINTELIFNPQALEEARLREAKRERNQSKKKSKWNKRLKKLKNTDPDFNPHIKVNPRNKYRLRLDQFWGSPPKTGNERFRQLKNMTKFKPKTPSRVEYDARRTAFEKKKYHLLKLDKCYVCNQKAEHRHHIVLLKHGGTNIKENLVGLCELCHTVLHPWMVATQDEMELNERMNYVIDKD